MNTMKPILLFISSAFIVVFAGCGLCKNTEMVRITSPDGKKDFVLFVRDCGATTSYSLQGSVLKKGNVLSNSSGNAIIMGSENHDLDTVLAYPQWKENDSLVIQFIHKPVIYEMKEVMGVQIAIDTERYISPDNNKTEIPESETSREEYIGKYPGQVIPVEGTYRFCGEESHDGKTDEEIIQLELNNNEVSGNVSGKKTDGETLSYTFAGWFIDSVTCYMNINYHPDVEGDPVLEKERWIFSAHSLRRFNKDEIRSGYTLMSREKLPINTGKNSTGNYEGSTILKDGHYYYYNKVISDDITQKENIRFEVSNKKIKGSGVGKMNIDGLTWGFDFDGFFIDSIWCKMDVKNYPNGADKPEIVKETWVFSNDSLTRYNENGIGGVYVEIHDNKIRN